MGIRYGGRSKGVPNKLTRDIRAMIQEAVDGLGGAERLIAWAKSSPVAEQAFWTQVMPKILPKDVNVGGQPGNPLTASIRVVFVGTDKDEGKDA